MVRQQLLFKPGDRYSRRLLDESERLLRAASYFYDAWIRPVRYHDGKVDLKVTTSDVWTLNPGFNYGRSGGTNSTGLKLEEGNLLGTGTSLKFSYENDIDRSGSSVELAQQKCLGQLDRGGPDVRQPERRRDPRPDRHATLLLARLALGGVLRRSSMPRRSIRCTTAARSSTSSRTSMSTCRPITAGHGACATAGCSAGPPASPTTSTASPPVTTSTGTTKLLPADRRFVYPFIEFDLVQDDYLKLWNHDQIARTEDFTIGTSASLRLGYADADCGLQPRAPS